MKKVILTLLAIAMSVSAFAQIKVVEDNSQEVGKITMMGSTKEIAWLSIMDKNDEVPTYHLMYDDVQYTHITSIKGFTFAGQETADGLYDILMKQMGEKKGTELEIEVGDARITIITYRMLGMPYLRLFIKSEGEPMGVMQVEPYMVRALFNKPKEVASNYQSKPQTATTMVNRMYM